MQFIRYVLWNNNKKKETWLRRIRKAKGEKGHCIILDA